MNLHEVATLIHIDNWTLHSYKYVKKVTVGRVFMDSSHCFVWKPLKQSMMDYPVIYQHPIILDSLLEHLQIDSIQKMRFGEKLFFPFCCFVLGKECIYVIIYSDCISYLRTNRIHIANDEIITENSIEL